MGLEDSLYSVTPVTLKGLGESFLAGKPFPYLLRESEFFHHRFFVDERVLIPRPETEHLVDMIARSGKKFSSVLDVGTGSGVIVLSLVKSRVAKRGVGSDVSPEALAVAEINRRRLRIESSVDLVLSDRLGSIKEKFDLIVSNPPYIKASSHRAGVHSSVDKHEPHLALFLEDQDYETWFRGFFTEVLAHLHPGGEFWMEGHEKEIETQVNVLTSLGFRDVRSLKDLSGTPRFLRALAGDSGAI